MVITLRAWARLSVLALAALFVVGCMQAMAPSQPKDDPEPNETYQPTSIPEDIDELFELYGKEDSDTVWIYAQGGPLHFLSHMEYPAFSHYPDHGTVQFVHVHQTLTLNHELAERDADWTLEELQAEVDVSVEILHRTIEHFKAQDKRVVVIGHSYGAFLVTRYLAIEGPDAADQYLIMAGRLDMPMEVVQGFLEGTEYWFPNAVDPEPSPVEEFMPQRSQQERMEMRIAAATGYDRYTSLLGDTDLAQVIYVYGYNDINVGRLAAEEIAFLQDRKSRVIEVRSVSTDSYGDHRAMFEPAAAKQISDALKQ